MSFGRTILHRSCFAQQLFVLYVEADGAGHSKVPHSRNVLELPRVCIGTYVRGNAVGNVTDRIVPLSGRFYKFDRLYKSRDLYFSATDSGAFRLAASFLSAMHRAAWRFGKLLGMMSTCMHACILAHVGRVGGV